MIVAAIGVVLMIEGGICMSRIKFACATYFLNPVTRVYHLPGCSNTDYFNCKMVKGCQVMGKKKYHRCPNCFIDPDKKKAYGPVYVQ